MHLTNAKYVNIVVYILYESKLLS